MKSIRNSHRRAFHHLAIPLAPESAHRSTAPRFVAPVLSALLAAGCASTQIGAQWVDPQWPKASLHGAPVLVVCEAPDTTAKLLCESRFSAQLASLGATPLTVSATADSLAGREATTEGRLAAAKAAGARAVLQTALKPDYSVVSSGPSFSIGIGGFGGSGGGSRSGVGGGVGVAVPVGGAGGGVGMAASSTLVDVGSAKVIWSAQATAPAGPDLSAQIDELAGVLIGGVRQAGIF